jgi:hypothetical protein
MSLRKSPQPTSQLLDAARCNARRSHGPRTAAGKENSKMNALQHGERSDPENHFAVMRALGEDPAQFEALKQELLDSFGPGDAFLDKQVDDLARLYWRRDRLQRMEGGLMRRALLELDARQHQRRLEIEGASFLPGQAHNTDLTAPSDPAARLRLQRSLLGLVREQVGARSFLPWQGAVLEVFAKGNSRWRPARLCSLLKEFADRPRKLAKEKARQKRADEDAAILAAAALWGQGGPEESSGESPAAAECVAQSPRDSAALPPAEPSPAPAEPGADPREELRYQELLALVEVEIAHAEREFEYEEKMHEARVAIERDACLAPAGEEWRMMLRREETLDRAIDRKIKLLLVLRKSGTGTLACAGVNTAGGLETGKSACPTPEETGAGAPVCAEESMTAALDVGAPLVGAQAHNECGPTNEQPSPEGRACKALALSSVRQLTE